MARYGGTVRWYSTVWCGRYGGTAWYEYGQIGTVRIGTVYG